MPLKIAAKVDRADQDYFNETIQPLLSTPGVEFIGEIGDDQKSHFLSGAIALLVPIDWPEPFGLVMIEAEDGGAPVVAFNRSVAEIVEDGVTGFVVEDETSAAAALREVGSLARRDPPTIWRNGLRPAGWLVDCVSRLMRTDRRQAPAVRLATG